MKRISKFIKKLRTNITFSISNPKTFKEIVSFNSNGVRVLSLLSLFLMIFALVVIYLTGGFENVEQKKSLNRISLERQALKIDSLTNQLTTQENFISTIKQVLKGDIPVSTPMDSLKKVSVDLSKIDTKETDVEVAISQQVKRDIITSNIDKESKNITIFTSPVFGTVSQEFNRQNHPGVDIVTVKDEIVKACLSGTVIYVGFTRKDGNVLIIEHGANFTSIYKHNKRILKKVGTKVQLGDPISIVGDTGKNSDGPHLHFELWRDQQPVDPMNYMSFKR